MSLTQEDPLDKRGADHGAERKPDKPEKTVTVTVDDDEVTVPKDTSPRAILIAAGQDPGTRQLVRVKGKAQEAFADPDQEVKVHQGEQFITVSTGGTPVS